MKNHHGWWWPDGDVDCRAVIGGEVAKIAEIAQRCAVRRSCVQAGGNTGLVPARLAAEFAHVYTFEPDAANHAALQANKLPANVVAFHAALGKAPGMCSVAWLAECNCGAHQTRPGADVAVMTVDQLGLADCDFLCLDIEGDELAALMGAAETIAASRPLILFEDKGLGERHGVARGEAGKWLVGKGYREVGRFGNDYLYEAR